MGFEVGDRVKILDNAMYGNAESNRGKIGNIVSLLGGSNQIATVKFDDGNSCIAYHKLSSSNDKIEIELVLSKSENSNPKKTMEKKVLKVLIVNKKTGKTEKNEVVVAENEQQAILKAFGVDSENSYIKVSELGSFNEEKPISAIIVKEKKE